MDQTVHVIKEPEAIRADIEQTRGEMGKTIGEIKEKLSSEHLKSRLMEATVGRAKRAYGSSLATTKQWSSGAVEAVRRNPVRCALVGAGVGAGIGSLFYFLSKRKGIERQRESLARGEDRGIGPGSHVQHPPADAGEYCC